MNIHEQYIKKTIELASKAKGLTSPNPLVGAVLIDENNNIVAETYHKKAGTEHAELLAIKLAEKKAKNGTLYVNLEPCCHFGKTPPCTNAIIQAGIKKVVIGCLDKNKQVSGNGVKILQEAGIEIIYGILEEECKELNKFFFHWIQTRLPYITIKVAISQNNMMVKKETNKQITNELSQKEVHKLRSLHDAILTGSGTILDDNPELTVRLVEGRNPIRIVLDRRNRLQKKSEYKVFQKEETDVIHWQDNIEDLIQYLGQREFLSLMVEAGPTLSNYLIANNLFQELIVFQNKELCLPFFAEGALINLQKQANLKLVEKKNLETDLMLKFIK